MSTFNNNFEHEIYNSQKEKNAMSTFNTNFEHEIYNPQNIEDLGKAKLEVLSADSEILKNRFDSLDYRTTVYNKFDLLDKGEYIILKYFLQDISDGKPRIIGLLQISNRSRATITAMQPLCHNFDSNKLLMNLVNLRSIKDDYLRVTGMNLSSKVTFLSSLKETIIEIGKDLTIEEIFSDWFTYVAHMRFLKLQQKKSSGFLTETPVIHTDETLLYYSKDYFRMLWKMRKEVKELKEKLEEKK